MIPSSYRFINTMGDEKIKNIAVATNKKNIEEIKEATEDLVVIVRELREEIKEILELVKQKQERDMNKWW